ncbi:MAG: GlsB/YeaQ/YmgE family stress response membrane protein [Arenicellales bacterium]
MSATGLIVFIIIGGIAGWLAGQIIKGRGLGLPANILVGIIGAFIGGFLLGVVGFSATNLLGQVVSATIGSVVLLYVARLLR